MNWVAGLKLLQKPYPLLGKGQYRGVYLRGFSMLSRCGIRLFLRWYAAVSFQAELRGFNVPRVGSYVVRFCGCSSVSKPLFKFSCHCCDTGFLQDFFVSARHNAEVDASFGQITPSVVRIERTPQGMPRTPQQMHFSFVRPRMIFHQCSDMGFPNFSLLQGEGGQ